MVDDPEKAVLAIFWESVDAIEQFERTPTYECFWSRLGLDPTENFVALRWRQGFEVGSALQGRITLTKLVLPQDYVPKDWGDKEAMSHELPHVPPKLYVDPRTRPMIRRRGWARADEWLACGLGRGKERRHCYHFLKLYLEGDRSQAAELLVNMINKQ